MVTEKRGKTKERAKEDVLSLHIIFPSPWQSCFYIQGVYLVFPPWLLFDISIVSILINQRQSKWKLDKSEWPECSGMIQRQSWDEHLVNLDSSFFVPPCFPVAQLVILDMLPRNQPYDIPLAATSFLLWWYQYCIKNTVRHPSWTIFCRRKNLIESSTDQVSKEKSEEDVFCQP